MDENKTFNRLSETLDADEKAHLLQKLRSNTVIAGDEDGAATASPSKEEMNIEVLYAALPWYRRLFFFIMGLFLGKNRQDLFTAHLIDNLGREIELNYPGMYDGQNTLLMPGFLRELTQLKESARFFSSALDSGVLANYGAFLIFLGSLEMPELHGLLQKKTSPALVSAANPGLSGSKLKSIAIDGAETVIGGMNEEMRLAMYRNARSLFFLKELAFFLYDRLILAFQPGSQGQGGGGQVCPFSVVRAQLLPLNNILTSFKKMPSLSLLSSLYVFIMQNNGNAGELENEREMQKFTSGAEKALLVIRNFTSRVPLSAIIRCGTRNTAYEPSEVSGGEEWFSIFRDKWLRLITENFNEYILNQRHKELNSLLAEFFKDIEMESFEHIRSNNNPDGIPVNGALFLSFILTFHRYIFMGSMNNILRPILIDGEFYKRENRIEFTEAYNELIKIDDMIRNIEKKLAPAGEWGKQWKQINQEVQSIVIKHRKTGTLIDQITVAVEQVIESAKTALSRLENLIGGIIKPDSGGRYDTLSNMAKMTGKSGEFIDGLTDAHKQIKMACKLFKSIENLDMTD